MMMFDGVNCTGFKEWEDGRHEMGINLIAATAAGRTARDLTVDRVAEA
jgi:hypothetical protein